MRAYMRGKMVVIIEILLVEIEKCTHDTQPSSKTEGSVSEMLSSRCPMLCQGASHALLHQCRLRPPLRCGRYRAALQRAAAAMFLLGSLQNFGRKTEMQFIPERERERERCVAYVRAYPARGFVKLTPSANRIAGSYVSFNPSACACASSAMRARCPGWPPQ